MERNEIRPDAFLNIVFIEDNVIDYAFDTLMNETSDSLNAPSDRERLTEAYEQDNGDIISLSNKSDFSFTSIDFDELMKDDNNQSE